MPISSGRDAALAPNDIGDGLDQIALALADGMEFLGIGLIETLVFGGVFGGKHDGAAGESGYDGVHRGFCFAFGNFGPGRELRVDTVGSQLSVGDGMRNHFVARHKELARERTRRLASLPEDSTASAENVLCTLEIRAKRLKRLAEINRSDLL